MRKISTLTPLIALAALLLVGCHGDGKTQWIVCESEDSTDPGASATLADGVIDYSAASYTEKAKILGQLEGYGMKNHLCGIPLYDDGGYVEISNRLSLPVRTYITNYGFGTPNGTITGNSMYNGDIDESNAEWKSYFHSYTTGDSGTFNYWDSEGQDVADRNSMIASGYFDVTMNAKKDGYLWRGSLSQTDRPIMIDKDGNVVTDATKLAGTSLYWRVKLHTGAGYSYSVPSTSPYSAFQGREIAIDDYVTPFKAMMGYYTGSKLKRGTDISSSSSGFNFDGFSASNQSTWSAQTGVKVDADKDGLDFTFNTPKTQYYAMYNLSSSLQSPVPEDFLKVIGGGDAKKGVANFGLRGTSSDNTKNCDNVISIGAYVPTYWEKDKMMAYKHNDTYFAASEYHYDGMTEAVIADSKTAYEEFMANKLDECDIPSDYLDAHKADANALHTLGSTVIKMNLNSCTQDEWNYYFGPDGKMYIHDDKSAWPVKPIMSNDDFLDGLFYCINRKELANFTGHNVALGFLSNAYMIDPENGISYRNSEPGKAALEKYTGVDENGYSVSTATLLFQQAMTKLVCDGEYVQGTDAEPTEIDLQYYFRYQDTIDRLGSYLKGYIEDVFNEACPGFKLVLNLEVAGSSYTDCYTKMDQGEYDLADGAISGNVLNPLDFMSVCCTNKLAMGFCLNWGANTSQMQNDTPIVYDGKQWCYDGLWTAGNATAIMKSGINVPAYDPDLTPAQTSTDVSFSFQKPGIKDAKGKQVISYTILSDKTFMFIGKDSAFNDNEYDGAYLASLLDKTVMTEPENSIAEVKYTLSKAAVQALAQSTADSLKLTMTVYYVQLGFSYSAGGYSTTSYVTWTGSLASIGLQNATPASAAKEPAHYGIGGGVATSTYGYCAD